MERWLVRFNEACRAAGLEGTIMLGLDNYGPQQLTGFKAQCKALDILPVYTPTYCTDVVAPVDRHLGRFVKRIAKHLFKGTLIVELENWRDGLTSAEERRVQMAT